MIAITLPDSNLFHPGIQFHLQTCGYHIGRLYRIVFLFFARVHTMHKKCPAHRAFYYYDAFKANTSSYQWSPLRFFKIPPTASLIGCVNTNAIGSIS